MWINAIYSNKFVDTVYIDFSKAFDTVSHRRLLHKLTNYGISGNILQWFSSFLCDRRQRVKIGDVYSSYASVSSGVPIYKKVDASQVSNYRPISILPAMCRLFERILADDINFHTITNLLQMHSMDS